MYIIRKEFSFSAAHQLLNLVEGHPCSRIHGHNYIVIVELRSSTLNDSGFVLDYKELDILKSYLEKSFDHKNLNDFFPKNPTAENIAEYLFNIFKKLIPDLFAIEISETPKTNARYELS